MLFNELYDSEFPLPEIWVEPGRSIVGDAGTTLYTVGTSKDIPGVRKYIAVDGGMTDNPRPALYQSYMKRCWPIVRTSASEETVTVAGKCCESGDKLIIDLELPKANSGDLLAVFCTGAYNYAMASNYNGSAVQLSYSLRTAQLTLPSSVNHWTILWQ